ncbi:MAG TPA: aldose 1-epimerase family protein, partial [Clostridia bacterium]|nr:aldose 1-epimerase family protein [Clostridia bacterium]
MTPAENAGAKSAWVNGEYIIELTGRMRESAMFGLNLVMDRKITTKLNSDEIIIHDTIYNDSDSKAEFLILYHFNFGYPFLSPALKLIIPEGEVVPRTDAARKGLDEHTVITEPVDGFFEHVFFHHPKGDADGSCIVRLENPELKIGAYVKYNTKDLPVLTQWKSMRSGDYALGIEPGNSHLKSRKEQRNAGEIGYIEPFGKVEFEVALGFYDLK